MGKHARQGEVYPSAGFAQTPKWPLQVKLAQIRPFPDNAGVSTPPLKDRRNSIGFVALLCLASAAALFFVVDKPQENGLVAALVRVGIVMAALWLAVPAVGQSAAWSKAAPALIAIAISIAIIGRKLIWLLPIAIVVGIAVAFLRPRIKRRRTR